MSKISTTTESRRFTYLSRVQGFTDSGEDMETLSLLLVSERKHLENLRKTKEQNIRNTSWLSGCNGQIPVWGRFPEAPKSPIAALVGGIFSKLRLIKHQKFLLAGMFHQRRPKGPPTR